MKNMFLITALVTSTALHNAIPVLANTIISNGDEPTTEKVCNAEKKFLDRKLAIIIDNNTENCTIIVNNNDSLINKDQIHDVHINSNNGKTNIIGTMSRNVILNKKGIGDGLDILVIDGRKEVDLKRAYGVNAVFKCTNNGQNEQLLVDGKKNKIDPKIIREISAVCSEMGGETPYLRPSMSTLSKNFPSPLNPQPITHLISMFPRPFADKGR